MKTIFVVDDNDTNLKVAEESLEDLYNVMTMSSAKKLFALLEKIKPDLILLDIEMPEMNGVETLKLLKSNNGYADIPVIFLTAHADTQSEAVGFELGITDFVSKPFSKPVLRNRIKLHLGIESLIEEKTNQILILQNSIINILTDVIELRDTNTGGHILRTSTYVQLLIEGLLEADTYTTEIKKWNINDVIMSARLHDIGKIAIPDSILNKAGLLTNEEYNLIKTHTVEGEKIIDQIVSQTDEGEFLYHAKLFSGCHHEKWNGTGYPRRLKEMNIPLQGRIMAIADAYDALVSERPYKKTYTYEEAEKKIIKEQGRHFDPNIVIVFANKKEMFRNAAEITAG